MTKKLLALSVLFGVFTLQSREKKEKDKCDVAAPGADFNYKSHQFTTDEGVKVNLGAHVQLQGLGTHWELWMLQQGGMTNMEALEAATINGATYMGAGNEIGSLKEGKLADLIVLEENSLTNIRNTETVTYAMVNGRLFDTHTMNKIGNTEAERTNFWWENNKYSQAFEWHEEAQSFTRPGCGCHLGHQ
jgi:imidazolonepropionase-like amidohydrolase